MITRRGALLAGAAALGAPCRGHAQPGSVAFPQRPIKLWVPWPAGGATDLTLRLLAELAGRQLGQKVVVENRSGVGGTLAMPVLQQAEPDGYTIAQMPQPVFRAPHMQKLTWNPLRDTTPIIQISGVTFGVVVREDSALRSIDDLLKHAAAHPGALSIATNGAGTTPHVVLDELFARHGLSYIHVPYKGTAEQMVAVAAGQVMAGVNSNGFAPFVDAGQLRLLATFGAARTRRWPNVPTLIELGHGIVAMSPYGLAGPRGLPAAVVQALHDAFKAAIFDPAHIAELAKYDQEVAYLGRADYARSMRETFDAQRRAVERQRLVQGLGEDVGGCVEEQPVLQVAAPRDRRQGLGFQARVVAANVAAIRAVAVPLGKTAAGGCTQDAEISGGCHRPEGFDWACRQPRASV